MNPTPNDMRFHIARAIQDTAARWDAEGRVFPSVEALRAMEAGVQEAIAEQRRLHNTRAA